jgi:periplasmic protein CpxP/Spy
VADIGSEETSNMKRILLSAALAGTIIAAGIPSFAQATESQSTPSTTQSQAPGKHWRHHHNRMAHMAKKLNLTQDQQTQLKPIFQSQHQQVKTIKNDTSLTKEQKKEKFQALRQDTMAKVNNILTPQQQQEWQQMRAQHRHKGGEQPQTTNPQG